MYFQCSGESASSAGTEALTDPLEKMALDVGMLDRQYRKLMDRQKQAHIVVGGTYIHPVVCRGIGEGGWGSGPPIRSPLGQFPLLISPPFLHI